MEWNWIELNWIELNWIEFCSSTRLISSSCMDSSRNWPTEIQMDWIGQRFSNWLGRNRCWMNEIEAISTSPIEFDISCWFQPIENSSILLNIAKLMAVKWTGAKFDWLKLNRVTWSSNGHVISMATMTGLEPFNGRWIWIAGGTRGAVTPPELQRKRPSIRFHSEFD